MNARSIEPRGPVEVRFPFSLLCMLFLLIAAVLSIPWGVAMWMYFGSKEWRFARKMRLANRLMEWGAFLAADADKHGTLIEEWFSNKGPVRYWWTGDAIPSVSPPCWTSHGVEAVFDRQFDDFSCWCHEKYLDTGNVLFVSSSYIPWMHHAELEHLDGKSKLAIPVVAVYSGRWSAWAKRRR